MITLKEAIIQRNEIVEAERAEQRNMQEVLSRSTRKDKALLLFDNGIENSKFEFKSFIDKKEYDRCKAQLKRLKQRIERYNSVIRFIETNPSVDYLQAERARVENLIRSLNERMPDPPMKGGEMDRKNPDYVAQKNEFRKQYKIADLEEKLKNIKFILQNP